jgi:hypothetical protein
MNENETRLEALRLALSTMSYPNPNSLPWEEIVARAHVFMNFLEGKRMRSTEEIRRSFKEEERRESK